MAETEPRYMVIRESSLREVKEQVDHFIGLGWVPIGGLSTEPLRRGDYQIIYFQTLWLPHD